MRPRLASLALVLLLGLSVLTIGLPGPGRAQAQEQAQGVAPDPAGRNPDYDAWSALAARAEETLTADRASTQALEGLRAELATWRQRFLDAQGINAARIETLQSQIQTLGPAPESGESEAEDIATRRRDLNAQLTTVSAPRRAAEEAFTRAEGLIHEIDTTIRERQADELLSLGPSPLNPLLWPAALKTFAQSLRSVGTEVATAWSSEVRRAEFRADAPRAILFLLIAAALVLRGRATMEWFTRLIVVRSRGHGTEFAAFVVSLGQIIVPVAGITMLVAALDASGLLGLRGAVLADALPWFGITLFFSRWLGLRLFPNLDLAAHVIRVPRELARQARILSMLLGLVLGLTGVLVALVEHESYDEAARAVLLYPSVLLTGLLVARFGQIVRRANWIGVEPAEPGLRDGGMQFVGRAAFALGLIGPAVAAIGYLNAGGRIVFATAFTLALLGLLLVIHRLVLGLHAGLMRQSVDESREALLPILVSFTVVVASLPVFALIWGARAADLTEIWTQFREGFTIGETTISPSNLMIFLVVFAGGYGLTRLVQRTLRTSILPKTRLDTGGQRAVTSGLGYVGIFLAALVAITSAGIDLSSLAIVAGALSVGIGFGLQNIVSNFVAGIILLIERPIAEGDWIEVGPTMGIVKSISVRSTRIETFDRTDVIVPNADFVSGTVTNWTRGNVTGRAILTVGVAYGTDTRRVQAILKEIAQNHPLVAVSPEPGVDFMGFGADSLDFRIRAILSDVNFLLDVKTELYHQIAERFRAEGIEIPFAQRDLWLRNPEKLKGLHAGAEAPDAPNPRKFDSDDLEQSEADASEGDPD